MINALQLLEVTGFESLELTVDSFDTLTMPNATASILKCLLLDRSSDSPINAYAT